MILKIKKDDFSWLYLETNSFEIQSTYEDLPTNNVDIGPIDLSYVEARAQKCIVIERLAKEEKDLSQPPLKTFIFTDNANITCIGAFTGFVLNNQGQTVERL